jgi:5'-3' exonuclease
MIQPSKHFPAENPYLPGETTNYSLVIDGTGLLKICFADRTNGPLFQFLLQLRIALSWRMFNRVYCMWDTSAAGQLRYEMYHDYKKNRFKVYSEYDREIVGYMRKVLGNSKKVERRTDVSSAEIEKYAENYDFDEVKGKIFDLLEFLFVRQMYDAEGAEADDMIAYIVQHPNPGEKFFVISRDNDLTQLINDNVIIYQPTDKLFLHKGNFKEIKGLPVENVVLKKILCGDSSDNIKGIQRLSEKTLYNLMPEFTEKPVTLEEVIKRAEEHISERVQNKKKPIQVYRNIVERVTDGIQGKDIYDINRKLIDLSEPLISERLKSELDELIDNGVDPEGRSMEELYKYICKENITELMGDKFSSFFKPFKKLIQRELNYLKNSFY